MDPVVIFVVIAIISVISHGIFTGIALGATWYFGHVAEQKLLDQAIAIDKKVGDYITEMKKEGAEFDKIDSFLSDQQKMMTGYRAEITRGMGEMLDEKIRILQAAPGAAQKQSTADRLIGLGEAAVEMALQGV
jgi:hypothetical protein